MQKVVEVLDCGGNELEEDLNRLIQANKNRRIEAMYPIVRYEDCLSVLVLLSDENVVTEENQAHQL